MRKTKVRNVLLMKILRRHVRRRPFWCIPSHDESGIVQSLEEQETHFEGVGTVVSGACDLGGRYAVAQKTEEPM